MRDHDFGKDYDAIIYNICFAGDEKKNALPPQADQELIDNALRVTREGKPTMMIHCSMHTFMASGDWTECCGERTRHHDKFKPFATEKVDADHPAIKHFPDNWSTPGDELYETLVFRILPLVCCAQQLPMTTAIKASFVGYILMEKDLSLERP